MLKVKFFSAATLMVALATLAACNGEPLAPRAESSVRASAVTTAASANTIYRDSATVPFSFVLYASCANGGQGEVLAANGTLQYTGHWITTTRGERQHNIIKAAFTGSAIGGDTGEAYDIVTREFSQSNNGYGSDGVLDAGEELQRIRLRLTSRSTGASFEEILVGRFVQTPAGTFVLDDWKATIRCD